MKNAESFPVKNKKLAESVERLADSEGRLALDDTSVIESGHIEPQDFYWVKNGNDPLEVKKILDDHDQKTSEEITHLKEERFKNYYNSQVPIIMYEEEIQRFERLCEFLKSTEEPSLEYVRLKDERFRLNNEKHNALIALQNNDWKDILSEDEVKKALLDSSNSKKGTGSFRESLFKKITVGIYKTNEERTITKVARALLYDKCEQLDRAIAALDEKINELTPVIAQRQHTVSEVDKIIDSPAGEAIEALGGMIERNKEFEKKIQLLKNKEQFN